MLSEQAILSFWRAEIQMLRQGFAKNKFATQGRLNKMKVKKHKK